MNAADFDRGDARELLQLRSEFVPPALAEHHSTYHDVSGLRARIGTNQIPEELNDRPLWSDFEATLAERERELLDTVVENHAVVAADALDAYRNGR